jgi:hypothetical protein
MRLGTWTKRAYAVCLSAVLSSAACGGDDDKKTDNSGIGEGDGGSGNTGNNGNVGGNNNGNGSANTGNNSGSNNGESDGGAGNNNGGNPSDGGATTGGDAGPVCSMPCDDAVDCTTDTCVTGGRCAHELNPAACAAGQSCHPMTGCTAGKACAAAADCADTDGCTANERCDAALATCKFDPLDGDDDGVPPTVCGGGDCNDDDARIGPGQSERCNGVDDDCDGNIDDGAMCEEGAVCKEGSCQCDTGRTACGRSGSCVDLQTDPDNCGACGTDCGPAGTCTAGVCACPAPGMMCGDSCVNTMTSNDHCGGCDTDDADRSCSRNQACVNGMCADCGSAGQACCTSGGSSDGCPGTLTCMGTPGTPGAVCACASPSMMCGESCTDVTSSETDCGGCDKPCAEGEQCQSSVCTACGDLGEVCCKRTNGNSYCNNPGGGGGGGGGMLTCDATTGKCVE